MPPFPHSASHSFTLRTRHLGPTRSHSASSVCTSRCRRIVRNPYPARRRSHLTALMDGQASPAFEQLVDDSDVVDELCLERDAARPLGGLEAGPNQAAGRRRRGRRLLARITMPPGGDGGPVRRFGSGSPRLEHRARVLDNAQSEERPSWSGVKARYYACLTYTVTQSGTKGRQRRRNRLSVRPTGGRLHPWLEPCTFYGWCVPSGGDCGGNVG